jgi:acetylglutamate kinase
VSARAERRIADVVIKIGGSLLDDALTRGAALEGAVRLTRTGLRAVVVHGGGRAITRTLDRLGIASEFREGLRVTTPEAMEVIESVLAGLVNKELVRGLAALGAPAAGLCGADGGCLVARPGNAALGLVGEPERVDARLLDALLERGYLPVVASVAPDASGVMRNVNADSAAAAVAAAVRARAAVFLTDTPGVLGPDGVPFAFLAREGAARLAESGVAGGGMIPKIRAAIDALEAGVETVVICGSTSAQDVALAAEGRPANGTLLTKDETMRNAAPAFGNGRAGMRRHEGAARALPQEETT